jgi:hypothetical protein
MTRVRALKAYWKAIGGLIAPAVALFITDLPDGITQGEWLAIAAAGLSGGGIVAAFPSNKKKGGAR